jgi:hypothetical protein
MKYSIRGNVFLEDDSEIITIINKYNLWRLVSGIVYDFNVKNIVFNFEIWVNTDLDKNNLFDELKPFVNNFGGRIDWHECYNDEFETKPCIVSEVYRGLN